MEGDGEVGVGLQRPRQHDAGFEQLAEPAHERPPTSGDRRGYAAARVHRRLDPELVLVSVEDRRVGGPPGVARGDQFGGQGTEVDAVREVGRERTFQPRGREAVVRALSGGQDLEAFLRAQRVGAEGPDRVGGQVRFEGLQVRGRHERDDPEVLQLRVAVHRSRGFRPAVEPGRRDVRVTGDERAGVGDQVLLVLDGELEGRGDLARAHAERVSRVTRVGVRHGARAEYRRDRPGHRERHGDSAPDGLAAEAD